MKYSFTFPSTRMSNTFFYVAIEIVKTFWHTLFNSRIHEQRMNADRTCVKKSLQVINFHPVNRLGNSSLKCRINQETFSPSKHLENQGRKFMQGPVPGGIFIPQNRDSLLPAISRSFDHFSDLYFALQLPRIRRVPLARRKRSSAPRRLQ